MAAPASEPTYEDTTTPEPHTMAGDPVVPDGIEGNYQTVADSDGLVAVNITVTQQDPELRSIEAILVLLQMLPYETRLRALTYVRDRTEGDPNVWGTRPTGAPATQEDIAQILAESDGREWGTMTATHQSPYFRRAQALTSVGFALIRAS
jgi:hypothetical protein